MRAKTILLFLCGWGVLLVQSGNAQSGGTSTKAPSAKGPWIGTWKYNAAKSTPPGRADGGPRIFKMELVGEDGFRYTIDDTSADGRQSHMEMKFARFDEKDYPEQGNPSADTNRFRIADPHTYELTDRKDGKDTIHFRITISDDGKTRTSVSTGVAQDGKEFKRIGVWDRQ